MQNNSAALRKGDGIEAQLLDECQRYFGQRQHALRHHQSDRHLGVQRSRIFDSAQGRRRTVCGYKNFMGRHLE